MKSIYDTISATFGNSEPRADEYRNEADGLLYCAKCRSAKQILIFPKGESKALRVPTLCKCMREASEREAEAQEKLKHIRQTEKLRRDGLKLNTLMSYRFENDKGYNKQMEYAKRYVSNFQTFEASGKGLLLWGSVGTGKTYIAACIANALIDEEIPVYMTNFSRILLNLSSSANEDKLEFIDSLDRYRLLIIDDLGTERNTSFAQEQVYGIIDHRCQSGKPMIITTNLSLSDMQNETNLSLYRIYDRIFEHCIPIKVDDLHARSLVAKEKYVELKKLLDA